MLLSFRKEKFANVTNRLCGSRSLNLCSSKCSLPTGSIAITPRNVGSQGPPTCLIRTCISCQWFLCTIKVWESSNSPNFDLEIRRNLDLGHLTWIWISPLVKEPLNYFIFFLFNIFKLKTDIEFELVTWSFCPQVLSLNEEVVGLNVPVCVCLSDLRRSRCVYIFTSSFPFVSYFCPSSEL